MVDALEHLETILDDLGPFDGVIGFSQGAALAISYIYDQKTRHNVLPFKVALLFSSVCAFSPDVEYSRAVIRQLRARGLDLSMPWNDEWVDEDERNSWNGPGSTTSSTSSDDVLMSNAQQALYTTLSKVIKPLRDNQALLPDIDLTLYTTPDEKIDHGNIGTDDAVPRLLLPQLMKYNIAIPTVHMHGKRDAGFMREMSLIAREMFDEKLRRTLEHSGSHHPPQKEGEVKAAVRAMEWAIAQSRRIEVAQ